MFWGTHNPLICVTPSHSPLQGTEGSFCSLSTEGHVAGSKSCCPYSALNHVLGSLVVGAAILGKQVFAHFKKGFSLLINPVHILIKIQTLTLSGTPNVPDIWKKKSNAFLFQPYLSIVCFHNDPCHLFCFFISPYHSFINPLPISTCLFLFVCLHLGIVLLPVVD